MGHFVPVFLALLLNCFGIYIFREPKIPGCGPLLSCLIFMNAVFILLWDIRLYPTSLRKLKGFGHGFVEFMISIFLFEHIISDFWLPLEASMIMVLPKLADYEEELLRQTGWGCQTTCEFLKWEGTGIICSYVLSTYFLLAVLHATRAVDFRLLKCGFGIFFDDVMHRIKKLQRRLIAMFGIKKKKSVRFNTSKKPKLCRPKKPICSNRKHSLDTSSYDDDNDDNHYCSKEDDDDCCDVCGQDFDYCDCDIDD